MAWNKRIIPALLLIAGVASAAQAQSRLQDLPSQAMQSVELRALNKMTARTSLLHVNIGELERFDTIELEVESCWSAPPDQRPEHKALIKITELMHEEGPKELFHGWMFASSPALNALEHPVYDIAVVRCQAGRVKD